MFDVDELASHGGSLRVYAQLSGHRPCTRCPSRCSIWRIVSGASGTTRSRRTRRSPRKVIDTKWRLLEFLIAARRDGKRVAGYGAPGKGNTLSTTAGSGPTCSSSPSTAIRTSRGSSSRERTSRSVIPKSLEQERPDYILILPWNLKQEIVAQLGHAREWGARFVVPIPEVEVL